jgi:hypothetical protein
MMMGCLGFAGFSLVIDSLLEEKDPRDEMELLLPDEAFLAAEEEEYERERERDMAELAELRQKSRKRIIMPEEDEEDEDYSNAHFGDAFDQQPETEEEEAHGSDHLAEREDQMVFVRQVGRERKEYLKE